MRFHYYFLALILYFIPSYAIHPSPNPQDLSENEKNLVQSPTEQKNLEELVKNTHDPYIKVLLNEIITLKKKINGMETTAMKKDKDIQSLTKSIIYIVNSLQEFTGEKHSLIQSETILSEPIILKSMLNPIIFGTHSKITDMEARLNFLISIGLTKQTDKSQHSK